MMYGKTASSGQNCLRAAVHRVQDLEAALQRCGQQLEEANQQLALTQAFPFHHSMQICLMARLLAPRPCVCPPVGICPARLLRWPAGIIINYVSTPCALMSGQHCLARTRRHMLVRAGGPGAQGCRDRAPGCPAGGLRRERGCRAQAPCRDARKHHPADACPGGGWFFLWGKGLVWQGENVEIRLGR